MAWSIRRRPSEDDGIASIDRHGLQYDTLRSNIYENIYIYERNFHDESINVNLMLTIYVILDIDGQNKETLTNNNPKWTYIWDQR